MRIALVLAAALVAGSVSSSFAADRPARGQVSHDVLADMGLGDMQVLSDHDGQAVRGKAAWLVWFGNIPLLNTPATGNAIIAQGLAAAVHFPQFRGFYVPPGAF
jgi:hypothetical protein